MSSAALQMRAHFKHRGLVFWSFLVPALYYVPIITILTLKGSANPALALWGVLALSCAAGFFLASGQQEIFNRSTFFLLPGMARGMVTNQLRMGAVVAVMAMVAAVLLPGLSELVAGAPLRVVSVACAAVLVYALVVQVALQFTHISWIVFQLVWLQIFLIKPVMRIPAADLGRALDQTSLWLVVAVGAGYFVLQQVRTRALHRRIAERPYLSIADVKDADKVQEFKRLRSLHKTEEDTGPRPFAGLLVAGLRQVAQVRREGRPAMALAWEAVLLAFFQNMPRRWLLVAVWGIVLPLFLVMGGYFDSYNALDGSGMDAWFVGLPFMAAIWVAQAGQYLRHPAPARLWDRGTRRRALWPALGLILAWGTGICAALFAFGHLAAAVLPPLTISGAQISMVAPRWDVFGILPFALPLQMIVLALWRNPRCCNVAQQAGTLVFFFYHGLVRIPDTPWRYGIVVGLAVVALALLPFVWKWRVGRTDQP